jgi:membrane protein DedA with SNARE-associated domain
MHSLLAWITQYGYGGLFFLLILGIVGAPVPDETLLVFCGYLVYIGRLHFAGTLAAGFFGSTCGISISYYLGRSFGRKLLDRYGRYVGATAERVASTQSLFLRIGPLAVSVGYFIPGVRHFTAIVAGMSGLRFRRFALFAYIGAAVWVSLFVSLGFVFGERWEHTSEVVHRLSLIVLAVGALAGLAAWFFRRRRLE